MVSVRVWTAIGCGLVLALTMTVISCFSVDYKSGTLKCNPDDMGRQCPVGSQCVAGYCYVAPDLLNSSVQDAAVSDGAGTD
jgi:hypothetical protein